MGQSLTKYFDMEDFIQAVVKEEEHRHDVEEVNEDDNDLGGARHIASSTNCGGEYMLGEYSPGAYVPEEYVLRECSLQGIHTLRWGLCARGVRGRVDL